MSTRWNRSASYRNKLDNNFRRFTIIIIELGDSKLLDEIHPELLRYQTVSQQVRCGSAFAELPFPHQFRRRGFREFRTFCQKIRNPHRRRRAVSVRFRVVAWGWSARYGSPVWLRLCCIDWWYRLGFMLVSWVVLWLFNFHLRLFNFSSWSSVLIDRRAGILGYRHGRRGPVWSSVFMLVSGVVFDYSIFPLEV